MGEGRERERGREGGGRRGRYSMRQKNPPVHGPFHT